MAKRKQRGKRIRKATADRYIEQHGATEPATIWDSGKQTVTGGRRRCADAALQRMLSEMGPMHVQAAEEIEQGHRMLARSLGATTAQYEPRGATGGSFRGVQVSIQSERFIRWGQRCMAAAVDYAAVTGMLIDGLPAWFIDRQAGKRNGWAVRQLERGLDLWWQRDEQIRRTNAVTA